MVDARGIREYIRTRYLEPARQRRETLVTIRAGDVHRELGLRNRVANVCQVMESRLLEKEAGARVSSKQGPPSGRGTTLTVTYMVDLVGSGSMEAESAAPGGSPTAEQPWVRLFYEMRGMGKDLFAAEGGGEAFLNRERAEFYGPGKKDLQ
jgi:5-methylcytosine-specific restriction protein B